MLLFLPTRRLQIFFRSSPVWGLTFYLQAFFVQGKSPIGNRTRKKRGRAWQSHAAPYFDRVPRFLVRHSSFIFHCPGRFSDFGKRSCHGPCGPCKDGFRFTVAAPRGNDTILPTEEAYFTQIPLLSTSGKARVHPGPIACRGSIPCVTADFKKKGKHTEPSARKVPWTYVCAHLHFIRPRFARPPSPQGEGLRIPSTKGFPLRGSCQPQG